ncbi:MAG: HU family DNA-binding protein [Bacteroidales bacterium]|nr:HU family DNA-binding protein [Bacteroidales bacterium]
MNTKEFTTAFAESLKISRKDAAKLLQETTRVLRETLAEKKSLSLQRLGNFRIKTLKSRSAYLPALGQKALIPPRDVIQYQPSAGLKNKLKNTPTP